MKKKRGAKKKPRPKARYRMTDGQPYAGYAEKLRKWKKENRWKPKPQQADKEHLWWCLYYPPFGGVSIGRARMLYDKGGTNPYYRMRRCHGKAEFWVKFAKVNKNYPNSLNRVEIFDDLMPCLDKYCSITEYKRNSVLLKIASMFPAIVRDEIEAIGREEEAKNNEDS